LAWLRRTSTCDPRGPLRNLEFWIEQLEERTGRDLESDLLDHVGERGWFVAFEAEASGSVELAVLLETRNGDAVEDYLLDLRDWLSEQASGRTLGLVVPRAREAHLEGQALHGTTFWTLLGEIAGPVFAVTDDHAVLATGDGAARRALRLLESQPSWTPVMRDGSVSEPPHEALLLRLAALTPVMDAASATRGDENDLLLLARAFSDLAPSLGTASLSVWYEGDAVRLRGRIPFAPR
jgi:hypothetical protein